MANEHEETRAQAPGEPAQRGELDAKLQELADALERRSQRHLFEAVVLLVVAVLVVVFVVFLFVGPAFSAPAPFPRTHAQPVLVRAKLVGTWAVKWGGMNCVVQLHADGAYRCEWCGPSTYVGEWWLDRAGRLHVKERRLGASCWSEYVAVLNARSRQGTCSAAGSADRFAFALLRRLPAGELLPAPRGE